VFELLASEYGYTKETVNNLTRREIYNLLNARLSRSKGYASDEKKPIIKADEDTWKKIEQANKKRWG